MRSQVSAVLPNTCLEPDRHLWRDTRYGRSSRSDRALRVTPNASAAAVTVKLERLEALLADDFAGMGRVIHLHHRLSPSPAGSVVIDKIDADHVLALELEDQPPIP